MSSISLSGDEYNLLKTLVLPRDLQNETKRNEIREKIIGPAYTGAVPSKKYYRTEDEINQFVAKNTRAFNEIKGFIWLDVNYDETELQRIEQNFHFILDIARKALIEIKDLPQADYTIDTAFDRLLTESQTIEDSLRTSLKLTIPTKAVLEELKKSYMESFGEMEESLKKLIQAWVPYRYKYYKLYNENPLEIEEFKEVMGEYEERKKREQGNFDTMVMDLVSLLQIANTDPKRVASIIASLNVVTEPLGVKFQKTSGGAYNSPSGLIQLFETPSGLKLTVATTAVNITFNEAGTITNNKQLVGILPDDIRLKLELRKIGPVEAALGVTLSPILIPLRAWDYGREKMASRSSAAAAAPAASGTRTGTLTNASSEEKEARRRQQAELLAEFHQQRQVAAAASADAAALQTEEDELRQRGKTKEADAVAVRKEAAAAAAAAAAGAARTARTALDAAMELAPPRRALPLPSSTDDTMESLAQAYLADATYRVQALLNNYTLTGDQSLDAIKGGLLYEIYQQLQRLYELVWTLLPSVQALPTETHSEMGEIMNQVVLQIEDAYDNINDFIDNVTDTKVDMTAEVDAALAAAVEEGAPREEPVRPGDQGTDKHPVERSPSTDPRPPPPIDNPPLLNQDSIKLIDTFVQQLKESIKNDVTESTLNWWRDQAAKDGAAAEEAAAALKERKKEEGKWRDTNKRADTLVTETKEKLESALPAAPAAAAVAAAQAAAVAARASAGLKRAEAATAAAAEDAKKKKEKADISRFYTTDEGLLKVTREHISYSEMKNIAVKEQIKDKMKEPDFQQQVLEYTFHNYIQEAKQDKNNKDYYKNLKSPYSYLLFYDTFKFGTGGPKTSYLMGSARNLLTPETLYKSLSKWPSERSEKSEIITDKLKYIYAAHSTYKSNPLTIPKLVNILNIYYKLKDQSEVLLKKGEKEPNFSTFVNTYFLESTPIEEQQLIRNPVFINAAFDIIDFMKSYASKKLIDDLTGVLLRPPGEPEAPAAPALAAADDLAEVVVEVDASPDQITEEFMNKQPVGIQNIDSRTCYANSLIQLLVRSKVFLKSFYDEKNIRILTEAEKKNWKGPGPSTMHSEFKKVLQQYRTTTPRGAGASFRPEEASLCLPSGRQDDPLIHYGTLVNLLNKHPDLILECFDGAGTSKELPSFEHFNCDGREKEEFLIQSAEGPPLTMSDNTIVQTHKPVEKYQYYQYFLQGFRCKGFIVKSGEESGGHYKAYVEQGSNWWKCDDSTVEGPLTNFDLDAIIEKERDSGFKVRLMLFVRNQEDYTPKEKIRFAEEIIKEQYKETLNPDGGKGEGEVLKNRLSQLEALSQDKISQDVTERVTELLSSKDIINNIPALTYFYKKYNTPVGGLKDIITKGIPEKIGLPEAGLETLDRLQAFEGFMNQIGITDKEQLNTAKAEYIETLKEEANALKNVKPNQIFPKNKIQLHILEDFIETIEPGAKTNKKYEITDSILKTMENALLNKINTLLPQLQENINKINMDNLPINRESFKGLIIQQRPEEKKAAAAAASAKKAAAASAKKAAASALPSASPNKITIPPPERINTLLFNSSNHVVYPQDTAADKYIQVNVTKFRQQLDTDDVHKSLTIAGSTDNNEELKAYICLLLLSLYPPAKNKDAGDDKRDTDFTINIDTQIIISKFKAFLPPAAAAQVSDNTDIIIPIQNYNKPTSSPPAQITTRIPYLLDVLIKICNQQTDPFETFKTIIKNFWEIRKQLFTGYVLQDKQYIGQFFERLFYIHCISQTLDSTLSIIPFAQLVKFTYENQIPTKTDLFNIFVTDFIGFFKGTQEEGNFENSIQVSVGNTLVPYYYKKDLNDIDLNILHILAYRTIKYKDEEIKNYFIKESPFTNPSTSSLPPAPGSTTTSELIISGGGGSSLLSMVGGQPPMASQKEDELVTPVSKDVTLNAIKADVENARKLANKMGEVEDTIKELRTDWNTYTSTVPIKEFKDPRPRPLLKELLTEIKKEIKVIPAAVATSVSQEVKSLNIFNVVETDTKSRGYKNAQEIEKKYVAYNVLLESSSSGSTPTYPPVEVEKLNAFQTDREKFARKLNDLMKLLQTSPEFNKENSNGAILLKRYEQYLAPILTQALMKPYINLKDIKDANKIIQDQLVPTIDTLDIIVKLKKVRDDDTEAKRVLEGATWPGAAKAAPAKGTAAKAAAAAAGPPPPTYKEDVKVLAEKVLDTIYNGGEVKNDTNDFSLLMFMEGRMGATATKDFKDAMSKTIQDAFTLVQFKKNEMDIKEELKKDPQDVLTKQLLQYLFIDPDYKTDPPKGSDGRTLYVKLNVKAVADFLREIQKEYELVPGYSPEEIKGINEYFQVAAGSKLKQTITEKVEKITKDTESVIKKLTDYGKKYAEVNPSIKTDILYKLEPQSLDTDSPVNIIPLLNDAKQKMFLDINANINNFRKQASSMQSSSSGGARRRKLQKGGEPTPQEERAYITATLDTSSPAPEKSIFAKTKQVKELINKFYSIMSKATDPTTALTLQGHDSLFNTLFNKYQESKRDPEKGDYVASMELSEGLKTNELLPRDVLKIDFRDKTIFVFATLFLRLLSLSIIEYLIDKSKITQLNMAVLAFLGIYTGMFFLLILLVNLDSYKLRIVFNYVNFHANSSVAIIYPSLLWIFGGIVYYIMYNINGGNGATAANDEDRLRLKYKIQVLSMITWIFLSLMVYIF